jgi:ABC-type glycerol-3-phosphate transport system permease component
MSSTQDFQPTARPTIGDRFRRIPEKAPMRLFLLAVVILWTLPTAGLLVSSIRGQQAIANSGWWTALGSFTDWSQWTFENYQRVAFADNMVGAFLNSVLVTLPATVIPITIAAFMAYGIAWMTFPGRRILFVLVVGLLVVPLQTSFIPVFLGTETPIVTTILSELVGSRGQDWHVLTAGAFMTMIMPMIVFFSLQRYFVRGMMAGSVKG